MSDNAREFNPVLGAEPTKDEPKATASPEAEQGEHISRPGPAFGGVQMMEWTWRDRLRSKLFPALHCDIPDAPSAKDCLVSHTSIEFSWLDRLRILLTGRCMVTTKTVTEHVIGKNKSESAVYVLPWRWMDRP